MDQGWARVDDQEAHGTVNSAPRTCAWDQNVSDVEFPDSGNRSCGPAAASA